MLRLRACILTHFLSSNSASPISPLHRLLSAAAVSPSPRFAVEEYLVETCGLTRDQALKASGKISHLKSPSKPDAVLAFLAGLGLSSADVIALVAKDPGFLCASVEKTLEPVVSVYARETRIFSYSQHGTFIFFNTAERVLKPSENHSEQESSEIAITKLLLQSYYSIVRKNVEDFVPKAIMHFLVNHTKWELHNFLITTLYKEEIFGDILIEPDEITTKRKQICETLKVLQQAYKLLKGRCKATLRDELPDFLEHAVSLDELHFNVDLYFLHLKKEEGDTIDWYFDSRSKFEGDGQSKFEDYHRLVLKNHLPTEVYVYRNYDRYRSLFTTYEMDKDYVNFVEEMSGKLNWLKSGVGFPETSDVWEDMHSRGALQVLKIAEQYTHMNFVLAYTAYREYIWSLRFHYLYRGDKDGLFFVIWKHTTKGQLTFEAALGELLRQNLFPRHKNLIQRELEKVFWCGLKEEYNSCVEGIPVNASEDDAKALIGGAVLKLHKGKKPLHQYMERKMHIARSIGLVKCLT